MYFVIEIENEKIDYYLYFVKNQHKDKLSKYIMTKYIGYMYN